MNVEIDAQLCVGRACRINNETYGFDTIRLKESNNRIMFVDTSTAGGFSSNDWQLVANQSTPGGASYFALRDCGLHDTGGASECGTRPFTIEAGAGNSALTVDGSGRVGFGLDNPAEDLHIKTGDSPAIRLEQDSSASHIAQTWDLFGNEAGFFVRDATDGALPFRIRPGAPTNSLVIDPDGKIGMGMVSPDEELHIRSADAPVIQLEDSSSGVEWQFGDAGNGTFKMSEIGAAGTQFRLSDEGLFRVLAVASPPTTSIGVGAMYNDSSGALCWYNGSAWLKVVGAGTCV